MFQVLGNYGTRGIGFIWYCNESTRGLGELTITFNPSTINKREALETIKNKLGEANEDWLKPIASLIQEWIIDADKMKEKKEFETLKGLKWFSGKIKITPEPEIKQEQDKTIKLSINFVLNPNELNP